MSQAQPEYAIILAILGVLLSIGIPSLKRGEFILGGVCIGLAIIVAVWWIIVLKKSRG